ncbi:hypothetical protein [Mariniflexile sp.]|uniref:hypothetical protein n=1 Tax=Mariniflexile sp. TaxID=1979402 RepID=UPI0035667543
MKIRFKKNRLYAFLVGGLIFIGLGLFMIVDEDDLKWSKFGYLILGLFYLGQYLFDLKNQYLTIENGIIKKNGPFGFGKKIHLKDIKWIKKYAGDYTLITESKKLKINTMLIEEKSLEALNRTLKELNLPADKTPFANIA